MKILPFVNSVVKMMQLKFGEISTRIIRVRPIWLCNVRQFQCISNFLKLKFIYFKLLFIFYLFIILFIYFIYIYIYLLFIIFFLI